MFNPLKMNPVEKRLLLGGIVGSLAYWSEQAAQYFYPQCPPELKQRLDPHLATNGEIIACVAPPLGLYVVKKVARSGTTKEKVGDLAFGSLLYSGPHLIDMTIAQTAYIEGTKARPAVRLTRPLPVKYAQTASPTRVAPTPSVGKYRLTA